MSECERGGKSAFEDVDMGVDFKMKEIDSSRSFKKPSNVSLDQACRLPADCLQGVAPTARRENEAGWSAL